MSRPAALIASILPILIALNSTSHAEVTIETVIVANPGNPGEWRGESHGGDGPDRICGAVNYIYEIGILEVTAGQYTEFLYAVARTDTYGLYDLAMWENVCACGIERTGSPGDYVYSVAADWAERPATFVSWGDAARFANWLHNGQPTGAQDLSTTEDGSYYLNGAMRDAELLAAVREPDATWVIPSEDEWRKAAYYDGGSATWYDYPTGTDSQPSGVLIDPDPGNNANFWEDRFGGAIGSPYWRTTVGEFENSGSPYGTFDQAGNVWEWNDGVLDGSYRGVSGGSFVNTAITMHAAYRNIISPVHWTYFFGFRVAEVPECKSDFDWDDDVDLDDFVLFGIRFDDLRDFAVFQIGFTGPQ